MAKTGDIVKHVRTGMKAQVVHTTRTGGKWAQGELLDLKFEKGDKDGWWLASEWEVDDGNR